MYAQIQNQLERSGMRSTENRLPLLEHLNQKQLIKYPNETELICRRLIKLGVVDGIITPTGWAFPSSMPRTTLNKQVYQPNYYTLNPYITPFIHIYVPQIQPHPKIPIDEYVKLQGAIRIQVIAAFHHHKSCPGLRVMQKIAQSISDQLIATHAYATRTNEYNFSLSKQQKFILIDCGVRSLTRSAEQFSFWKLIGKSPFPYLFQLSETSCILWVLAPSFIHFLKTAVQHFYPI